MKNLTVLLLTALAPAAVASTWYVNGVTGSNSNNCTSSTTACKTIKHAISLAASGDSIIVASATYTENLTIGKSLTIVGSGASTTIIDGGLVNTVVTISSTTAKVALSRLTISRGSAGGPVVSEVPGGGIINQGSLRLNDVHVTGNSAWSGGGIDNSGTLVINNSTISGNHAHSIEKASEGIRIVVPGFGAGIANGGTLTLNKSTISGNTASGTSGGGGISNTGTLVINNSTISGNVLGKAATPYLSGGGGIFNSGQLGVNNSTVSQNGAQVGGNIFGCRLADCGVLAPVTLQNSIVANSLSGGNCHGALASHGYNLSSDSTCKLNNTGDMNSTDPMLGSLQNNGGPTKTMALSSGSPAIDAGNPSGCTGGLGHLLKTDQRGAPRPDPEDTGGCDIGAFERQSD